jgi:hypothetical protein
VKPLLFRAFYETIVRQSDDIFCKLFAIILGAVAWGAFGTLGRFPVLGT